MSHNNDEVETKLDIKEIFQLLCEDCQEKLLSYGARKLAEKNIKNQLLKQWKE